MEKEPLALSPHLVVQTKPQELSATMSPASHNNAAVMVEFEVLAAIDDITPDDITEFQTQILPEYEAAAKKTLTEGEWLFLVALHKQPVDQLFELAVAATAGPLVGLHHVVGRLQVLCTFTGLPKYVELQRRLAARDAAH